MIVFGEIKKEQKFVETDSNPVDEYSHLGASRFKTFLNIIIRKGGKK